MKLKDILKAAGVDDATIEKIEASMKENKVFTAGEENLDIRYGKLKTDFDNLTAEHEKSTTLIGELQKETGSNEALQGKIADYQAQVEQLQTDLKTAQVEGAIKVALLDAKVDDIEYMTFKLKEKGEIDLDEQGHIKGIEDKIAGLKTQFPAHFESAATKKIEENKLENHDGTGTVTKEQFNKMTYGDRLNLFNENPELYNELKN